MLCSSVFKDVARQLGLPEDLVRKAYTSYWKAIKEHIRGIPLKEDLAKEDFDRYQVSVNVPCIGKFGLSYDDYKRIRNGFKKYGNKNVAHHRGKTTIHEPDNHGGQV